MHKNSTISDYLTEDNVEVGVKAKDWREAVSMGGALLQGIGCIEASYIQAMIDAVEELGPYIVIEKGIALSHARPEEGALKTGLSILVLSEPVNFGHPEFDPVKLIISLSTTDNHSHIDLISELSKLLLSDEMLQKVLDAKSKKELLQTIQNLNDI